MNNTKKKKRGQSTRQLMGLEEITDYSLKTAGGELVYFLVKPDNLSVLSMEGVRGRVIALENLLRGTESVRILALNSRESFERNKDWYAERIQHDQNPALCNLLRQVYLEYEDRVEEANLIFRFRMPQEKLILKLDSQKTYRVFENLYINIIKYAMTGSRVYVNLEQEEKEVRIELKNMSATELHVEPDELTERFVRGDSARNTEGSGLGLAIAKSFVQVQGGRMEVSVDGDLFKVVLWFKAEEASSQ